MREQADFLNDITDAPAQPDRIPIDGRLAFDDHLARGGIDQAVDQLHRRGLARAAASEQHQRLAEGDLQVQVGQKGLAGRQCETDVAKFNGDLITVHILDQSTLQFVIPAHAGIQQTRKPGYRLPPV